MTSDIEKDFNPDRNYEARRLEDKLDKMIGFFFWKTYVATTLWANVSTPINLTITIFTALMTAHSSTSSSFISNDMNMRINLVTFLVSIINSYFSPQKEFNELNEYLSKWADIGNKFEKVIFTNNTLEEKIKQYTSLLDEANSLYKEQYLKKRNFFTDLLHTLVRTVFMGSNDRWMKSGTFEFYEKIKECIELDFDLNQLKYDSKRASLFERLCWCFTCCIPCIRKKDDDTTKDTKDKRVPRHISQKYVPPGKSKQPPVQHSSLTPKTEKDEEIEMTPYLSDSEEDEKKSQIV